MQLLFALIQQWANKLKSTNYCFSTHKNITLSYL
nr:MAG TPA: hypothetical protein [Caudoviricetes sp.]